MLTNDMSRRKGCLGCRKRSELSKRVVDDDLEEWAKRKITAKELCELYVHFGEDPFIVPLDQRCEPPEFSAWNYAKERSQSLAAAGIRP